MHLSTLADANHVTITLPIPQWIFGGIVGAVVTVLVGLIVMSIAASNLGQDPVAPWFDFRTNLKAFVIYGLPVGLAGAYTWGHSDHSYPWTAFVVVVVLAAVTLLIGLVRGIGRSAQEPQRPSRPQQHPRPHQPAPRNYDD